MADDIASLCDPLGVVSPVIFGHSAGGFVALSSGTAYPGLASGLILCDTAPTLAPVPDDNPPPSLTQRSSSTEALAVASKLFSGYFFEAQARTYDLRARLTRSTCQRWSLSARTTGSVHPSVVGCLQPGSRMQNWLRLPEPATSANRRMAGRQSQRSKRPVSTS